MSRKPQRFNYENLEARRMMAGDVGIQLMGDTLNITGDDVSNTVVVRQLDADSFSIEGLNGTTINGNSSIKLDGINNIDVDLGQGNDQLLIEGINDYQQRMEGDLNIDMGIGKDAAKVDGLWIAGDAEVHTDAGSKAPQSSDKLELNNFNALGAVDITMGGGTDDLKIIADYWTVAYEGFDIDTGEGTKEGDTVEMKNVFTWTGIDIDTSHGADTVTTNNVMTYDGHFVIDTHGGSDEVVVENTHMDWNLTNFSTSLIINTGSGNDKVTLKDIDTRGGVMVATESGADTVTMEDVHTRQYIYMAGGKHDDVFAIKGSSTDQFITDGGSQDKVDRLAVIDSVFGSSLRENWELIYEV